MPSNSSAPTGPGAFPAERLEIHVDPDLAPQGAELFNLGCVHEPLERYNDCRGFCPRATRALRRGQQAVGEVSYREDDDCRH